MESIVKPHHAATMSNRSAIVTAVIDYATVTGPVVPYVADVMNGRSFVTHLRWRRRRRMHIENPPKETTDESAT